MKENEHRQVLLREISKNGLKGWSEITNGTHLRILWRYPDGSSDSILCAKTPSDHRSTLNSRARIRQKLKKAGVLERPLPETGTLTKALSLPEPEQQLSLTERVGILERDIDVLLDMLVEQRQHREVHAEVKLPIPVAAQSSRQFGERDWVLHFVPADCSVSTRTIADIAQRNYYTTYSALSRAQQQGLIIRDGKDWRRIIPAGQHGRPRASASSH